MKKILILKIFTLCLLLIAASSSLAQKIETKDGIRVFSKSGLLPGITGAEKSLNIKWGIPLEVGRADLLFASIVSICEDEKGNFYLLDRIEHKVFKFFPGILSAPAASQSRRRVRWRLQTICIIFHFFSQMEYLSPAYSSAIGWT